MIDADESSRPAAETEAPRATGARTRATEMPKRVGASRARDPKTQVEMRRDLKPNKWLRLSAVAIQLLALASHRWQPPVEASAQFRSLMQLANGASFARRDLSRQPMTSASLAGRSENVCQVSGGESVAIVEIEESRGADMSQPTSPAELPIAGSVDEGEIELRVESETHKYFHIEGKRLRLTRPLDRDATLKENSTQLASQPVSSIYLQVSCLDKRERTSSRKVIIPVLVKVLDLNDNAPKFTQPTYTIHVDELTPVDSIVLDQIQAIDLDSANNGLVEYSLLGSSPHRLVPREKSNLQTTQPAAATTTTATPTAATPTTTTMSASVAPETSQRTRPAPTINLESEPIANGPMEEPDEEESDEALLAAMNATTDAAPETEAAVHPPARRRRRHSDLPEVIVTTTRRLPTTTVASSRAPTTTLAPAQDRPTTLEATPSTSRVERSRPHQLWTNLMVAAPNSLDDATGALTHEQRDSSDFFSLEFAHNSNRPILRLKKPLDYETQRVHTLTVLATDRAANARDRLSSSAKIVVRVLDGDDQGPAFVLDQTGCATSSFRPPTTSDPAAFAQTSAPPASRRRRSVSFEEPAPRESSTLSSSASTSSPPLQHRGFKVTDENFDFGDTLVTGEDEHEAEDIAAVPVAAIAVPPGDSQSPRARRFPPPAADASSTRPPSQPTATTRSRHLDYSCLTGTSGAGQAEYFASVMSGDSDYLLRVAPQAIKARDRDELNAPIRYSFLNGTPANYSLYFQMNALDASIKQVAPVERQHAGEFTVWVQAQEQTAKRLASLAKLTIEVVPSDKNPPVLVPNSYAGFVEENAPVGSSVFLAADPAARGPGNYSNLLRVSVLDGDASSPGAGQSARNAQLYEFETTSDAFKVNRDGFVFVNRSPLDRDPPNQSVHMFQVTARQLGLASARSLSSPISLNVTLLDLNDNPPALDNSSLLAVHLSASNERSARLVTTIRALDRDSAENARMLFSIRHVSNNGRDRFRIRADSGELEALGRFAAGEQFSLTVQVADELGRSAQGIVDVLVTPGPNTGGPQFVMSSSQVEARDSAAAANPRAGYTVEVSEGIAPHSAIFQVQATDPENDPIAYSIVDGNVNNDFYINSRTGSIHVANRLDREEVSAYSLLVQARDSGGLASARRVHITVADTNDQNPAFARAHYTFAVEEGVAGGRLLGRVEASDGDAAENGQVAYQLAAADSASVPLSPTSGRPLFSIDEQTGEIRLLEPLDYERAKSHALIVTARDLGENPRSSTAGVLVKVLDVQDEAPYFERYYHEARLVENVAQQRVAQVSARDPDSVAQISYVMKSGDASLFAVDAATGLVSTIRGLDAEESRTHMLLIGTQESAPIAELSGAAEAIASSLSSGEFLEKSPVCRVDVSVVDVNDNAPQFPVAPLPVRVQDSAQLGAFAAKISAQDLDASEPNNQIRYELVSSSDADVVSALQSMAITSDECLQLFMIDASSGSISVKSDLKRDSRSECQLIVRARDLGQPSLSTSTSVTIFIDHIAEISPTSTIGFADSSFTVELAENSAPDSLVKLVPVINKPKVNFPLSCEIVSGNELGKFYVLANEQRDCELRTSISDGFSSAGSSLQLPTSIDYEQRQRYSLALKLSTIASSAKTLAHVTVNILDRNDNRPIFQQPPRYSHLTQQRFLAAIATDSPTETQVIRLRATDADSPHANGLVSYEILNDNELEARFKVDPSDGILRTSRPVEDIPSTRLPLRVRVVARDNPEAPADALESVAEVVVNLIDDRHRLALVLKDTPTGRALDSKEELLAAIQERTGLIPGLERAESLKVFRNGSLESDVSGTDFWFYLVEPGTFRIVSSDESRVRSTLLEARAQSSLLDIIGQNLGFAKAKVRLPYSVSLGLLVGGSRSLSVFSTSMLPSRAMGGGDSTAQTLIAAGMFIAVASAIVVLYQCGAWSNEVQSRATKEKLFLAQQQQRQQQLQYQQQQQQHYGFSMGGCGLTGNSQDLGALQSALANLAPAQIGGRAGDAHYQLEHPSQATFSKEYETQMLKMSVLFDDGHSVDEQNLSENLLLGGKSHRDLQ